MERDHAIERLESLVGKDLRTVATELGITVYTNNKLNKGWAGQTVERYLGLPLNSARSPNLGSWELKVIPLKKDKDGRFVVKETMAITMLDPVEVKAKEFSDSHLFTKLRKLITVSREHSDKDESSLVLGCHAFELENTELFDDVSSDYELIRNHLKKGEQLSGYMGNYVQPRTKGPGHGSTSRAFYARKKLVEYIIGQQEPPRKVFDLSAYFPNFESVAEQLTIPIGVGRDVPTRTTSKFADCTKHAGKDNLSNRVSLDELMIKLPANQSGKGRHKCSYCAFEAGFRAGVASVSGDRKDL